MMIDSFKVYLQIFRTYIYTKYEFKKYGLNGHVGGCKSSQLQGQSKQTEHWLASAAIIQNGEFFPLPDIAPQEPLIHLPVDFYPHHQRDWYVIRNKYKCAYRQFAYKYYRESKHR